MLKQVKPPEKVCLIPKAGEALPRAAPEPRPLPPRQGKRSWFPGAQVEGALRPLGHVTALQRGSQ